MKLLIDEARSRRAYINNSKSLISNRVLKAKDRYLYRLFSYNRYYKSLT